MRLTLLIGALLFVLGCGDDPIARARKIVPPEDEAIAKNYFDLLRQKKFDQIEKDLDASIRGGEAHGSLVKMGEVIPDGEPVSIKVVGLIGVRGPDFTRTDIMLEYEFPDRWLLATLVTLKKEGVSRILGVSVYQIPDSLERLNRFTLAGKSAFQYVILGLAILAPLFSLYVLVVCMRTKVGKWKWLWAVFILVGLGKLTLDWTTGQYSVSVLAFQVPCAQAIATPYGPWMISVSLPLGAMVFLSRLRSVPSRSRKGAQGDEK